MGALGLCHHTAASSFLDQSRVALVSPKPKQLSFAKGICGFAGICRFHIRQKLIFLFFFFKVDRWSGTGGSEFTPCSLFVFNHSTAGYFWIHNIFPGTQRCTIFYWGINSGLGLTCTEMPSQHSL